MRTLAAAALVSVVAIAGCSSGSSAPRTPPVPFYSPTVALRDVKLGGVGITGGAMDVTLKVYNPNDYRLLAPRVSYRVLVDTVQVAKGIYDADIELSERDSALVRLPVSVSYIGASRAGRALMSTGAVQYRILGHITVGTPYGRLSAPYDRIGSFSNLSGGR